MMRWYCMMCVLFVQTCHIRDVIIASLALQFNSHLLDHLVFRAAVFFAD